MKHIKATTTQIIEARLRLQNPYAFIDDRGRLSAIVLPSSRQGSQGEVSAEKIRQSRLLYQNPYAYLNEQEEQYILTAETNVNMSESDRRTSDRGEKADKYAHVARKARELQVQIWKARNDLWPEGTPTDPVKMLDPSVAAHCIGYDLGLEECLGAGDGERVAGVLDRSKRRISLSRRLPRNTYRFTAAHEIGHALLHKSMTMHRDSPLDGSQKRIGRRNDVEIEADKFASYFLMPEKLVRERFRKIFLVKHKFILTEETAFALGQGDPLELMEQCNTRRKLARALAKAGRYNGLDVNSLSAQFGVTTEAMAIRLEELNLV